MLLRWLMIVVIHQCARAYNLDLRYPLLYSSDSKSQDDYFGFSVAIHPGSNIKGDSPWMMVGAPHSTNKDLTNVKQPGLVYKCPLTYRATCTNIGLKTKPEQKENLNGNMLGSVQDIQHGQFVSCAPRWMKIGQNNDRYNIFGECFTGDAKAIEKEVQNIQPLNNREHLTYTVTAKNESSTHPYFVYGEAGFAAHFSDSNKKNDQDLVLGAPGVFTWFGTTILYKGFSRKNKNSIRSPIVANPYLITNEITSFALFGYSLSSGKYFKNNEILHAAGAPRGSQTGRVLVYTFPNKNHGKSKIKNILLGQQIGEYFGASLASCDIDGDGFDDLLVGAPFFSSYQDEGRVYIFYGNPELSFTDSSATPIINGKEINGRFGTTISCVGDLDQDGLQEIAIGAPYDGNGVVYIYTSVSQSDWRVTQKITPPNDVKVKGFGISISRGQDIDQNGYNDFAIGAYLSGHAFVFRTRPVVTLNVELYSNVENGLARNSSQFQVNECIEYTGHQLPATLDIVRTIVVDPTLNRFVIDDSNQLNKFTSTVHLSSGPDQSECFLLKFTLKASTNKKNYFPIKLETRYQLPEINDESTHNRDETSNENEDKFCSTCPVLKNKLIVEATTEILFATQCGNDNICNSQVSVHLDLLDHSSGYIVGSAPSIPLRVTVRNAHNMDPAYNTRVKLTLPVQASRSPLFCKEIDRNEVNNTLSCDVADPLESGSERTFNIELDMQSNIAARNELQISANTSTSSVDQQKQDNWHTLNLKLSSLADVTVTGSSDQEMYLFDNKDNKETSSKKDVTFVLEYQVERFGISPVHKVELIVKYPTALLSDRTFLRLTGPPKFKINSRPQRCESDFSYSSDSKNSPDISDVGQLRRKRQVVTASKQQPFRFISENLPSNRTLYVNCTSGDWQCSQVRCVTGPFVNNQTIAKLELFMTLDSTVLEKQLGLRDYILYGTNAKVNILEPTDLHQGALQMPDEVIVTATMRGRIPEGRVESWVLAISCIGGIFLLMMLVTGLIKAGFFERKQKDALIKLKRETQLDLAALQRMHDMEDQDDEDGMEDTMQDLN